MKGFAKWMSVVVAAAALIASCSKDKPTGSIAFDAPAVYLQPEEMVTIGYSLFNIEAGSVSVTTKPEGWDHVVVDTQAQTVTIKAPKTFSDEVVKSGSIVINGYPKGGTVAATTLFVGVNASTDLGTPANSYIASQADTHYTFDAMLKGDGRSEVATVSLAVIWQYPSSLVQYLDFKEGKASFYIGADSKNEKKIKEGNALIGAYDAAGTLVWSWHIWAADYNPQTADGTVDFNGYTFMKRNLGALQNANATDAEILASMGLYYQWGRKEPFLYLSSFDSTESLSMPMYNGSGTRVKLAIVASSVETGTMAFATQNPLTFITSTNKDADWMWASDADYAGTPRWDTTKTVNDPCPSGWQVAPAAAYAGLAIKESLEVDPSTYENKYGWTLTKDGVEALFIAAGRRSYRDAVVQNHFDESLLPSRAQEMQPWVGYYWTTGVQSTLSTAFTFWFRKDNIAQSGLRTRDMGRANGMSVRCVKVK